MNGFYNNGFNFSGYAGYNPLPQQQYIGYQQPITQPAPQPKTNKIFVTSLQEAMSRPAEPNTEIIYLHQNEPFLFQITTDIQGIKTQKTFRLIAEEKQEKKEFDYVARSEFEELKAKLETLFANKEGGVNE